MPNTPTIAGAKNCHFGHSPEESFFCDFMDMRQIYFFQIVLEVKKKSITEKIRLSYVIHDKRYKERNRISQIFQFEVLQPTARRHVFTVDAPDK